MELVRHHELAQIELFEWEVNECPIFSGANPVIFQLELFEPFEMNDQNVWKVIDVQLNTRRPKRLAFRAVPAITGYLLYKRELGYAVMQRHFNLP